MRILVTGADGFIGHHLVEHVLVTRPGWTIDALCSFSHGGIGERLTTAPRLAAALADGRLRVHTHDLTRPLSAQLLDRLAGVDFVANLASRSHVDTSLADPVPFFRDNADIALNVLEACRAIRPAVVVHVSTDEVYGPAAGDTRHREWDPIAPSNPYSASKAAQEAAAFTYWRAYGVPVVIANTMNNIGERQAPEKFVPRVIRAVRDGDEVSVHAVLDGPVPRVGSRFYLHARNHADALVFLLERYVGRFPHYGAADRPPRYHVVGEVEVDNLTLARRIAELVERPLRHRLVDVHSTRPGHDLRYALDGGKLAAAGWVAPIPFWESLARTVRWTLQHPEWLLDPVSAPRGG